MDNIKCKIKNKNPGMKNEKVNINLKPQSLGEHKKAPSNLRDP